ncbi:MFS transporter [Piscirickettsia litoralis]|uniref:Major facilitator superfamily (MFS) profile domain-containing protein n=1 Tax=Piscirickettsia litoralis TaxID=1891921 RepID=A0ABX3A196_9GAMM|nr:MFS transporter [Piscirickettsia litoralis]ODN42255.1 hypothetical protein BGC07_04025 [Piscirickettsia litoralis]
MADRLFNKVKVNENNKLPLVSLIVMVSLASVGSVLPSPALSEIASAYSIPAHIAEWVVTLFVLGYALSQLIYGPIANAFGRKRALYFGLGLSIIGSILSSFATNIEVLLVGRLIMSFGAGCGLNITFTMINDYYDGPKARRVTAYVTTAFAILPGIAIAVGGELTGVLGWRSCFEFLLLYYVIALIFAWKLPETATNYSRDNIKFKPLIMQYQNVILDKVIYPYALLWGMTNAVVYMMAAVLPIIALQEMKLTPVYFGFSFLLVTAGYVLGNFITGRLSHSLTAIQVKMIGGVISLTGVIALTVIGFFFYSYTLGFFLALSITYMGLPMVLSTAVAVIVQRAEDKSTTSSVTSFIAMMMGFLAALIAGWLQVGLYWKVPLFALVVVLVMCILIVLIRTMVNHSSYAKV